MTMIYAHTALTPQGWQDDLVIRIEDGRLSSILHGTASDADQTVEVLLPAPVNLHSHAFQRAMAGLSERRGTQGNDTFWTWRQIMYRFLDHMTPDDVEAIAAVVQMEMAEAGYGAHVEFHYLHHASNGTPYDDIAEMGGRILAASNKTGLGVSLAPVLYQVGGCDGRVLGPGQIRFGSTEDAFADLIRQSAKYIGQHHADSALCIAPHSLRAVTESGLRTAIGLAGADHPIHIHLSEQIAEVEEVRGAHGTDPVTYLMDQADIGANWCLIHCTQADQPQIDRIAASGAIVGLCPITEANLGDGIFNARRLIDQGGAFGVGSDSNIKIALSEELRILEYTQRGRDHARAVLSTEEMSCGRLLYEKTLAGGAQAAGRDTGRLAIGAWADLLGLKDTHGHFDGIHGDRLLDSFVFAGGDRCVSEVWSAGRHMVSGGQHIRKAEILATYRPVAQRLRGLV